MLNNIPLPVAQQTESGLNLSLLPDLALDRIAAHLKPEDQASLARTCHKLRQFVLSRANLFFDFSFLNSASYSPSISYHLFLSQKRQTAPVLMSKLEGVLGHVTNMGPVELICERNGRQTSAAVTLKDLSTREKLCCFHDTEENFSFIRLKDGRLAAIDLEELLLRVRILKEDGSEEVSFICEEEERSQGPLSNCFQLSDKQLAVASHHAIHFIDLDHQSCVSVVLSGAVSYITPVGDEKITVVTTRDTVVMDARGNQQLSIPVGKYYSGQVSVLPTSGKIISAPPYEDATVWDNQGQVELTIPKIPSDPYLGTMQLKDGRYALRCSRSVFVYSKEGQKEVSFDFQERGPICSWVQLQNEKLALGFGDGNIGIINLKGELEFRFQLHKCRNLFEIFELPDGKIAISKEPSFGQPSLSIYEIYPPLFFDLPTRQ